MKSAVIKQLVFFILCAVSLFANAALAASLKLNNPYPDSAYFLPYGHHVWRHEGYHQPNNDNYLMAGVYRGVTLGTFINSYNDRVVYLGIARRLIELDRLSINLMLGGMIGYGENLKHGMGDWLGHDPGPLAAASAQLKVTNHITMIVATYGIGTLFGIGYEC